MGLVIIRLAEILYNLRQHTVVIITFKWNIFSLSFPSYFSFYYHKNSKYFGCKPTFCLFSFKYFTILTIVSHIVTTHAQGCWVVTWLSYVVGVLSKKIFMLPAVLTMFAGSLLSSCGSSKSRRSALILAHTKHSLTPPRRRMFLLSSLSLSFVKDILIIPLGFIIF